MSRRQTPTDLANRIQLDQAFQHLLKATQCLDRITNLDEALATARRENPARAEVMRRFVHLADEGNGL